MNTQDAKGFHELVADDYTVMDLSQAEDVTGKEANLKKMKVWLGAFPDVKVEASSALATGDYVVREITWSGTNKGAAPAWGIEKATGKPVTVNAFEVIEFKDGKLKEWSVFANGMAVAGQLG
jgi:predicted ester cyclase